MAEPIFADGPIDAPAKYVVPGSSEIIPLAVQALLDGTNASGDFVPTLIFRSQAGHVIARVPTETTVAAGGSAEVSWFPGVKNAAAASTGTTIAWGTVQVSPLTAVQSFDEFPDPTYSLPFDFTNHFFHEDGSGIFSFDPLQPTELIVNPPTGGLLHLGASFRHTPSVDLVVDTDIGAFLAANGAAYQPPIGIIYSNGGVAASRRENQNPDVNPPQFSWFQLRDTVFTGNQMLPTGWSLQIENLGNSGATLDASQASIWGYFIG